MLLEHLLGVLEHASHVDGGDQEADETGDDDDDDTDHKSGDPVARCHADDQPDHDSQSGARGHDDHREEMTLHLATPECTRHFHT